ncbi:ribose-phosphate pyrophosphokinase [Mycoplasma sp. 1018B]|uniref:ribose-phosphate pyrophosphokinase n=1 Tax=Mycoplasma sp. 1018B TaxID=2967302 RepID=UPI00211CBEF9|nr:ribose-phosphate pyrophosphokinase [Mycoplasma sp. 1018B]UUM19306.1 ribose-phosphate pyrophosphokinase [Mycoplasma sp. 1018B]
MIKKNIMLFSMFNCQILAEKISRRLNIPLSKIQKTVFADGEIMIVSEEAVREKDVFIICSTHKPVNDNLVELLLFIDSLKRASAKSINLVLTYYGYARQDRKERGRQPIGAKLIADLLQTAGANKIIAVDLHNPAIQGFFNVPIDDLKGTYTLAKAIIKSKYDFTVVSPDHGGTTRARSLAELIAKTVKIGIIDKRRIGPDQTEVMGVIGEIENKNAVIIDDIIDTGGTIIKAAKTLKANGAKKIIIAATHGVFTNGFDIFENNDDIEKVIISDSIDNYWMLKKYKKLEIVSLDYLLSEVINCHISGESITKLYNTLAKDISNVKWNN